MFLLSTVYYTSKNKIDFFFYKHNNDPKKIMKQKNTKRQQQITFPILCNLTRGHIDSSHHLYHMDPCKINDFLLNALYKHHLTFARQHYDRMATLATRVDYHHTMLHEGSAHNELMHANMKSHTYHNRLFMYHCGIMDYLAAPDPEH